MLIFLSGCVVLMFKRFVVGVMVFCAALSSSAYADDELTIIYTYGKTSLAQVLHGFSTATGVKIKIDFMEQNDLKSGMLGMMELNSTPDVIIMPADHVGLHSFIKYSVLEPSMFPAKISARIWASGSSDGQIYGAPLIQGNHLMLFYNKSLVAEAARDWDTVFAQDTELKAKGLSAIAWSYDEAYWFLPFLGAYGGWPLNSGAIELNTPSMISALAFYKSLRVRELPYPSCSYQCAVDLFKSGKIAYTINGDWIGREFYGALGDNLGVSAIPMAEGKKMLPTFSTHVVAFPKNGFNGSKRANMEKLVNYLQSSRVQRQLWEVVGAIPVEDSAFAYAKQDAKGYLKETLILMNDTKPLPADKEMTFIWDAIGKGFVRHREGALDAPSAAKYMQQLAERHLRNAQRQANQEQTKP